MNMKKILALLLVLALTLGCVSAVAETKIEVKQLSLYQVRLNENTNTLYGRAERNAPYAVFDLEGNALTTEAYTNISAQKDGYEVTVDGDPLTSKGFLNGQGQVVIPAEYGNIDDISPKWQAGIRLVAATADNYDYKVYVSGGDNIFALIDTVDFYFNGTLVGSLPRAQYKYTGNHGDYLYVSDREGTYHHYTPALVETPSEKGYSSEYVSDYKANKTYHAGSGQVAFDPSCTLTAEEVEVAVNESRGKLYDLQGNVIADTSMYYSVYSFSDGVARTRSRDDKYGMINDKGEQLAACIYDDMDYNGFKCGYLSVVKDGKQGFVALDGTENAFIYPESAVKVYTPFAYVQQLDGTVSVISAAAGELPGRYADYKNMYDEAPFAVVQDSEGKVGAIGLAGEVIVPFDGAYDSLYDLDISKDGTLVLGDDGRLFMIEYDLEATKAAIAAAAPATVPAIGGSLNVEPENAGWTCPSCGNANGPEVNFCPNDGTKKPEVPAEWTCPSCNNVNAPEANFCPNDGTKKPE